jgi:hypothetical protein
LAHVVDGSEAGGRPGSPPKAPRHDKDRLGVPAGVGYHVCRMTGSGGPEFI